MSEKKNHELGDLGFGEPTDYPSTQTWPSMSDPKKWTCVVCMASWLDYASSLEHVRARHPTYTPGHVIALMTAAERSAIHPMSDKHGRPPR